MADKALMPILTYWESRTGSRSKSQAYAAAASGAMPSIRIGRLLFVPVAAADRALGISPDVTMALTDFQPHALRVA